jgi:hypothetical protein
MLLTTSSGKERDVRGNDTKPASRKQNGRLRKILLAALSLTILFMIWPTASAGAESASADSVTVSKQLLIDARETIDELELEVAVRDSQLVAQRDYYIELIELQDQRIATLKEIIEDLKGSTGEDVKDALLWGALGYTLRAATE